MPDPQIDEGVPTDTALDLQLRLDATNEADPPTHFVPHFLANFRHPCTRARQSASLAGKGVSTAIDLKERYLESEDGEVALIYREGKCKKCLQVARSEVGRAVLTSVRPPVSGRVSRS